MKRLITSIICLFYCLICFAQLPDEIKHIEIVSEVSDTMVLLNKPDLDKINTAFYRLECADSLNAINEQIIDTLNAKEQKLEQSISVYQEVIKNKDEQISNIKEQNKEVISDFEKQVKRANRKITF